jgi:phosphatidate phosphatase APP1
MTSSPGPIGRFLHALAAGLERDIDTIDSVIGAGEGRTDRVRMLAYAGYRNDRIVRVSGRIVRYGKPLDAGEGMLSRMRAMLAIYDSKELPGIAVRCEGYGLTVDTVTDEEGYFRFELPAATPLPASTIWEQMTLSTPGREAQQERIKVPVLAPGTDNRWGVISDIDDTLVETGATDFIRNWRRVLVDRPQDRLAVPGAASLYGMIAGSHAEPVRPFFYVSSSPWNLYGFIAEFMELNRIPHGPMFLKDYGIDSGKLLGASHSAHKLAAIETILGFYPGQRFLLIGDNGQHDVEIYREAVRTYPGRVGAVLIRDVGGHCREGAKARLLAEIEAAGVPTFCGAGFDAAIEVVKALDLESPAQIARAAAAPA